LIRCFVVIRVDISFNFFFHFFSTDGLFVMKIHARASTTYNALAYSTRKVIITKWILKVWIGRAKDVNEEEIVVVLIVVDCYCWF